MFVRSRGILIILCLRKVTIRDGNDEIESFNFDTQYFFSQVSSATVLTGASSKSTVNADVKPRERFEDVTDHDNTCEEEANKLLSFPSKSNLAAKPADLDLD